MAEATKPCSKCGEVKPHSAFVRDRAMRSGRKSNCKSCAYAMTADWKARNAGYVRPPRDYGKERLQQRLYRIRRAEFWRSRWQTYYAENKAAIAKRRSKYWAENPEKLALKLLRRQVRKTAKRHFGIPTSLFPRDLADSKVAQLMVLREVRLRRTRG